MYKGESQILKKIVRVFTKQEPYFSFDSKWMYLPPQYCECPVFLYLMSRLRPSVHRAMRASLFRNTKLLSSKSGSPHSIIEIIHARSGVHLSFSDRGPKTLPPIAVDCDKPESPIALVFSNCLRRISTSLQPGAWLQSRHVAGP
jgi:hypothetical protein